MNKPGVIKKVLNEEKKILFVGGTLSFVVYATVVWAFTQAPVPLVAALRETSIIFALLIGSLFLKEKFTQTKYLSLINDISALAPIKFITEIKKNDDQILLIFDEIKNDLKKFELNQKIDNLEKKMIQNMNEETYKELLALKRQVNNS